MARSTLQCDVQRYLSGNPRGLSVTYLDARLMAAITGSLGESQQSSCLR